MALFNIFGYRGFANPDEIARLASEWRNAEGGAAQRTLLIFSTSKQHTWLVVTEKLLICVLDDIRKDVPRVQWGMPIDTARTAQIDARLKTERTGTLDIGERKRWLYSTRLFQEV